MSPTTSRETGTAGRGHDFRIRFVNRLRTWTRAGRSAASGGAKTWTTRSPSTAVSGSVSEGIGNRGDETAREHARGATVCSAAVEECQTYEAAHAAEGA